MNSDLECLIVFSALEQFSDAPVVQSILPESFNGICFLNNPTQHSDYLDNLLCYVACESTYLPFPRAWHVEQSYKTLTGDMLEQMWFIHWAQAREIDLIIERSKDLDFLFNKYLKENNYAHYLMSSDECEECETTEDPFYAFVRAREVAGVDLFLQSLSECFGNGPFSAEHLYYRVTHTHTSVDDLYFYINTGLKTSQVKFYESLLNTFTGNLQDWENKYFNEHNLEFTAADSYFYKEALKLRNKWGIPIDLAYRMASREFLFNLVHFNFIFYYLPGASKDLWDIESPNDFYEAWVNLTMSHSYFVVKREHLDQVALLDYYKIIHDEPFYVEQECVYCKHIPATEDRIPFEFLGPKVSFGILCCKVGEQNDEYLIRLLDHLYDEWVEVQEAMKAEEQVSFFSMGRLYLFTLFTSSFFLFIYIIFCYKLFVIYPNIYQFYFESIYNFVFGIVSEQAGLLAVVHVPLVFTVFNVILYGNIIGLIPYGFTVTSHLTFTFSLGLFIFIGIILLTILNKRAGFFNLFIPTGVPKLLVPLLCVIEIISYVFRVVSLSVRLFANMMAGHALLHILLGFVPVFFTFKNIIRYFFIFPIIIIILITVLEIGISLLQSYVFIVLISIYLRDCYGASTH